MPAADGEVYFCSDLSGQPQVHVLSHPEAPLTAGPERHLPIAASGSSLLVRHDAEGNETWQLSWLVDGALRNLTSDLRAMHTSARLSPDGQFIGLAHNPSGQDDLLLGALELDSGRIRDWSKAPGFWLWAAWSPAGDSAVAIREVSPTRLQAYHLLPSGTMEPILPEAARVANVSWTKAGRFFALTDLHSEYMRLVEVVPGRWDEARTVFGPAHDLQAASVNPAGDKAAVVVNEGAYDRVLLLDLDTGRVEQEFPTGEGLVVESITGSAEDNLVWSADGRGLYAAWHQPDLGPDLYELFSGERLTRSAGDSLAGGKPLATSFTSFDGLEVPALLYRRDEQPRPTVVYFHGGPESQLRAGFQPLFHLLLEAGINVFAPNVRGSTGYGRKYFSLDDRQLRWDAVRDGCAAGRHLLQQGLATKVAAMGRSYGGFMTLAVLVAEPDLWKAAVEYVGIADWHSFFQHTSGWRRAMRVEEYGDPNGAEADFLARISPLRSAGSIRAPLLVVHGRNDVRVPVGEAHQIAAATGAELLIFEDEGHGIAKRANERVAYLRTVEFLAERLGA